MNTDHFLDRIISESLESYFVPKVSQKHIELEDDSTDEECIGKGGERMVFDESHGEADTEYYHNIAILHESQSLLFKGIFKSERIYPDEDGVADKQKCLKTKQKQSKYLEVLLLNSALASQ